MRFFCETSLPFYFVLLGSKFFPGLYCIIFSTPMQFSWLYLPHTRRALTCLLCSISRTQPTWHFCWRKNCFPFTSGNKWTSCYATNANHEAFPLEHSPFYTWKKVHILSCHPRNLFDMSKEFSCHYPTISK